MRKNHSKRIIVWVEDNIDFAELAKEYLETEGDYTVMHFSSANEASAYIMNFRHSISAVISDVLMHGQDGFDFYDKIQPYLKSGAIPFMFVSALEPMVFHDMLRSRDIQAFLSKPMSMEAIQDELVHQINYTSQNRRMAG